MDYHFNFATNFGGIPVINQPFLDLGNPDYLNLRVRSGTKI